MAIPFFRPRSGQQKRGGGTGTTESLRSTFRKPAVLGRGGCITGAMQNPNDHKLMQVVDGIVAGKTNAQPGREVLSRRGRKWKAKQPVASLLDLVDEARRCCL
jgi:hypothetical protein